MDLDDDDFEEFLILNEFEQQRIVDDILQNAELIKELESKYPDVARQLKEGFRAEKLVEKGFFDDIEEARVYLKELRSHRKPLKFCRDAADQYMEQLTDLEFQGLMRMSRSRFEKMSSDLEAHWVSKNKYQARNSTPSRFQLAGCLRWLAGGSPHDIIFFCGLRYRTFRSQRWNVLDALIDMYYKDSVKMPETEEERKCLSALFEKKNGISGQLGAIDGLLVHIILPANTKNARTFQCYKSYYALNVQGVAGPTGEFLYINIGHAGATSDGCASRQSQFWADCAADKFKYSLGYHFLGDAAYSLMPWLITPFEGTFGVNSKQDIFNLQHARGRQVIERAFGMMIKRWRILVSALEFRSVIQMAKVVRVCAMLHNICLADSQSSAIIVSQEDLHNHPFDISDPDHGLVEKVRLHVRGYRDDNVALTEEEKANELEKLVRKDAVLKRSLIMTSLHDKGYKRDVKRGAKRGAAYQQ